MLCCVFIVLALLCHGMMVCVVVQVHEHTNSDDASLKKLIKQLLAIICRPARLLEVLVRKFIIGKTLGFMSVHLL